MHRTPAKLSAPYLDQDFGEYHFRSIHETEIHMNTPDVIYKMQEPFPDFRVLGLEA